MKRMLLVGLMLWYLSAAAAAAAPAAAPAAEVSRFEASHWTMATLRVCWVNLAC